MIKNIILAFCIVLVALIVSYIGYSINSKTTVEKDFARLKKIIINTDNIIVTKLIEDEENKEILQNAERSLKDKQYYVKDKITEKEKIEEITNIILNGNIVNPTPNTMTVLTYKPEYEILFLERDEIIATFDSDLKMISKKSLVGDQLNLTYETANKIYEILKIN